MRRYRLLIFLLVIDVALALAHIFLRQKLGFFNLDKEQSLKASYSGFQLLAIGGTVALYTWLLCREKVRRSVRWLWGATAVGFFYLAIDEMMTIHERIGFVLNRWTGLTGYWGESFNWLLYFAPLIAAGLLAFFFLIRSVWEEDRTSAWMLILGTFFLGASIVFEVIGGRMLGGQWYQTLIIFEETSQLIGESLFLGALAPLLNNTFNKLYILRI